MFSGSNWPWAAPPQPQQESPATQTSSAIPARRLKAIQVLNRWKRERNNQGEVIDFLIEELALRERYDGVE